MRAPYVLPAITSAAILLASCGGTSRPPVADARAAVLFDGLFSDGVFHCEETTDAGQRVLRVHRAADARAFSPMPDAGLVCEARAPRGEPMGELALCLVPYRDDAVTLAIVHTDEGLRVAVRDRRGVDPSVLPDALALVRRAPLDLATPDFIAAMQAHLDAPVYREDGQTTAGALLGPDPAATLAQVAEVVRREAGDRALSLHDARTLLMQRLFEAFERCGAEVTDPACVASARRSHPSPDEMVDAALADAFDAPVPEAFADVLEGTWMPDRPLASEGPPTFHLRAADGELAGVLTLVWADAPLACRGPHPGSHPGSMWTGLSCRPSYGDEAGESPPAELAIRFAGARLEVRPLGDGWVRNGVVIAPAWLVLHRVDALALALEAMVRQTRGGGGVASLRELGDAVLGEDPAARKGTMYAALVRALDARGASPLTLDPASAEQLAGRLLMSLATMCAQAVLPEGASTEPTPAERAEGVARFDGCVEREMEAAAEGAVESGLSE
jgi:hypothetical protein